MRLCVNYLERHLSRLRDCDIVRHNVGAVLVVLLINTILAAVKI